MEMYFKITACLLLIVHAFHLASLQYTTDTPGRTIDGSWYRKLADNSAGGQNVAVTDGDAQYDWEADTTAMEPSNDYNSGTASGSMAVYNGEEENVSGHEQGANKTSDDLTVVTTTLPPTAPNGTTKHTESPDPAVTPTTTTTDPSNPSQINMTEADEESHNLTTTPQTTTTHLISQSSTLSPDFFNRTDLQSTTLAPESNDTQESTAKPEEDTGLDNSTGSTSTTTAITTTTPEVKGTSTTSSSTTVFPSETTELSPETTTAVALDTPENVNKTNKDTAAGSSSERGTATVSGVTVSDAHLCVQKPALCGFVAALHHLIDRYQEKKQKQKNVEHWCSSKPS